MKIELKAKDGPVLITRTAYWYSPKEKNSIVGDILKGDSEDLGWLASSFVNLADEYTYSFYGIRPVSANYVGVRNLINSNGRTDVYSYGLYPIILLSAQNLDVTSTLNDGTSLKVWNIK